MLMILLAAGCYTITSLSDKYAVAKLKLNGREMTFIMAAATVLFMTLLMPFVFFGDYISAHSFGEFISDWRTNESFWAENGFSFSLPAVIFILLIAADKLLEFVLSAMVLKEMSAFELKAWLGIVIFVSYFTDVFKGASFNILCLLFILVTGVGLFLIAKSNGKEIHYKKILLPLIGYLAIRYFYGIIMQFGTPYMPSSVILYFALIVLTIGLLPTLNFKSLMSKDRKGMLLNAGSKLPNAVGLIAENATIAVSLTGASLIQPVILIALFFIGIIRKEACTKLNIAGGIISIIGIAAFQLANTMQ